MPAQSGHEQVIVISRGPGNSPSASRQTRSITCLDSLRCSNSTNEPTEPAQSAQIAFQRAGAATEMSIDRWWNPAVENQATDRAFRSKSSAALASALASAPIPSVRPTDL